MSETRDRDPFRAVVAGLLHRHQWLTDYQSVVPTPDYPDEWRIEELSDRLAATDLEGLLLADTLGRALRDARDPGPKAAPGPPSDPPWRPREGERVQANSTALLGTVRRADDRIAIVMIDRFGVELPYRHDELVPAPPEIRP